MAAVSSQSRSSLTHTSEWLALQRSADALKTAPLRLRELFALDAHRATRFSCEGAGLLLDYSKNLLDDAIRTQLLALAQRAGIQDAIAAMYRGDVVNNTEQRQVLHVALRSPRRDTVQEQAVHRTLAQMEAFVEQVTSGQWLGHDGRRITDVVNIGIGGSDLGPAMVYEALAPYRLAQIRCHFVSNVDPVHLEQTLQRLDAGTTLFVIASKTFTTLETTLNAQAARAWVLRATSEGELHRHFVAVSANVDKAAAFGIGRANIFPMWDWVGGRYSLWSAIGLPVALGVGMANFRALLDGAHQMDEHFRSEPFERNLPVLLALLAVWYLNFLGAESQVLLPYAQNLALFPAFLQQLDMESLGKSVDRDGQAVHGASGGIVWGSAGTNGQHSFHQLLHQGTHLVPADFIAVASSASGNDMQHRQLLANCIAQSQALMDGKTLDQSFRELREGGLDEAAATTLAPHRAVPGNRPSNMLLLPRLSPQTLGALIALYEHKVYAQSILLGINAFDQWGVELGKALSNRVYAALASDKPCTTFDASTNHLINRLSQNT
ncbi:MAG TPA: glucose-6-phosphate isomerase [Pseudomonadales bacterium]